MLTVAHSISSREARRCTLYDMATTTAWQRIPMSWAEFRRSGVRGEYIDGELIVAPLPSIRHQTAARRLANAIEAAVPTDVRVVESVGWKPAADEFGPDVIVFDDNDEDARFTGMPHLVIEVVSTDPWRDLVRKARKYAAIGLLRYWVVDPDGPEIIEYHLEDGAYVEVARHRGTDPVTLDIGICRVTLVPGDLVR